MMNVVSELLLGGIARTTLCSSLAALVTLLLLPALGICSTRIYRTAWVLVILQGWLLIPLTFTVFVPSEIQLQQLPGNSINYPELPATVHPSIIPQTVRMSSWQRYGKQTATAAWLLGALAVFGFYMTRYYSLVTHVPLGSVPESGDWKDEWREVADAIKPKANVHFRVTSHVGPLLCFLPFIYLVLVPKLLWASLSRDDRIAIFRHELAHLKNGDLWKNLAIRLLAIPQWFNPLVWLAIRRFEEAGEWACDEEVVASSNMVNTVYADTLLRVAGFSVNAPCGAVAASGGILTRRVTRLLSSSDKEVSKMRNLAVPVLLLAIAVGQAIHIESVVADEPDQLSIDEARNDSMAERVYGPYIIESPDVLLVNLIWKDFDAVVKGIIGNDENQELSMIGVQRAEVVKEDLRIKARQLNVEGKYIVEPDGTIKMPGFGRFEVAGMTIETVNKVIIEKLSRRFGIPDVLVDIAHAYSKVIYLIERGESGDFVSRIQFAGNETVLDALATRSLTTKNIDQIYVVPEGKETKLLVDRLAVDLNAITSGNSTENFNLLPGDRIFVLTESTSSDHRDSSSTTPPTEVQQGTYNAPAQPAEPNQTDGQTIPNAPE